MEGTSMRETMGYANVYTDHQRYDWVQSQNVPVTLAFDVYSLQPAVAALP